MKIRNFVSTMGLVLLAACSETERTAPAQTGEPADSIYSGGPIVTVDDDAMTVEAVAVRDGRIVAAGTRADAERYRALIERLGLRR